MRYGANGMARRLEELIYTIVVCTISAQGLQLVQSVRVRPHSCGAGTLQHKEGSMCFPVHGSLVQRSAPCQIFILVPPQWYRDYSIGKKLHMLNLSLE